MQEQETTPTTSRNDPESLAPVQIERLSVEDEIALMSRGKSGRLIALAAAASLSAAVSVFWLNGMDSHKRYADAIGSARELHERHADAFLHCALPNPPSAGIGSSEQLHSAIERISERLGKSYGRALTRCAPKLAGLVTGLRDLTAPGEGATLAGARKAAVELERAWDEYRRYLLDERTSYDYVQALPRVEKIALAWSAYERRFAELESALRARL
jgi:hypothetical protein